MDPNANLAEQRRLVRRMLDSTLFDPQDGHRLANLVAALDQWILSGGFLPDGWQVAQKRNS